MLPEGVHTGQVLGVVYVREEAMHHGFKIVPFLRERPVELSQQVEQV